MCAFIRIMTNIFIDIVFLRMYCTAYFFLAVSLGRTQTHSAVVYFWQHRHPTRPNVVKNSDARATIRQRGI